LPPTIGRKSPLHLFQYILPETVIHSIRDATNETGYKATSKRVWKDVITAELYAYIDIWSMTVSTNYQRGKPTGQQQKKTQSSRLYARLCQGIDSINTAEFYY
jgi:hypothetical protein